MVSAACAAGLGIKQATPKAFVVPIIAPSPDALRAAISTMHDQQRFIVNSFNRQIFIEGLYARGVQ